MESRLFILSIWCGVYGQIIRALSRRHALIRKAAVVMLVDSLFWATFLAMAGMLVASYSERLDDTGRFSVIFGIVGLIVGSALGYHRSRDEEKRDLMIKDNLEWADTGFSAILLASFVMFFIVQAFKIPSGSMRMTFLEGDHLFVNKFIYGVPVPLRDEKLFPIRKVQPGDIVIFRFPARSKESPHYGKDFIKRCVAVGGQRLQIINKKVFIDGVQRKETFTQYADPGAFPNTQTYKPEVFQAMWEKGEFESEYGDNVRDNFGPITVPDGCIFVMGDNRDRSFDSRFWGPLKLSAIKGKAWLLYWPPKRFHLIK